MDEHQVDRDQHKDEKDYGANGIEVQQYQGAHDGAEDMLEVVPIL